ncbi:Rossmann-like and DUF2520 domain-containing protein [Coprobacter tertius]|uniref:DUF2520 domain-containing protein n=1 Tax=Coprobacter tertius TaxID=2944915 RepID=A0ABT1MI95_9BACT|nr:Rossmann-like and DUF2520 domain-containing protein [Coprobacter tertius]MCP9611769.1 DUF2520 domain-containing protein [Coprobacter tertius]
MKIVFIGAGNLATQLSLALQSAGHKISQIYSRTETSARELSDTLKTEYTTQIEQVRPDADLYLFSVKDTVLPELIRHMPRNNGIWAHTAGSMPMNIFKTATEKYGVFYPLQTFSKHLDVTFSHIPIYIEGSDRNVTADLVALGKDLSDNVQVISSEQRKFLHLAAVFACNFTNYMYTIAADLLEEHDLSFTDLLPLIDETAAKIHKMPPVEAQTGPAIRYDRNVIEKHLDLLNHENTREIYELLSKNIHKYYHKNK